MNLGGLTIQEVLDELQIDYVTSGQHHHARPGWIQLKNCPFCSSSNYHFGVNLSGGFFSCWKCGGHNSWKVWTALGLARDQIRSITLGHAVPREITRISLQVPKGIGPMQPAHRRYLTDRGFGHREIERLWKVQGIGIASRLSWRLFIPIIYKEQMVSWTTRAISNRASQRYISASAAEEKINHKHLLYGQDYCYHSVVVVEGPLDAWKVGPGAVALFGTAFTTAQVKKLVEHPYRYIVFDSSKEAQRKAAELAEQLSVFPGVTETIQLDAEDPGSACPKEIRRLRRTTKL